MALWQALRNILISVAVMSSLSSAALALGQANLDLKHDPGHAIRRIIEQQLDAIRKDDAELAFSFASPTIRKAFRDAATFMALLSKDYAPMKRWEAATFLDLRTFDDHYVQRVKLVDKKGAVSVANYALIKGDTGEWYVAGVAIEDAATKTKTE